MLKNLRRNSKQLFETRRKSTATVASIPEQVPLSNTTTTVTTTTTRNLTFFDLPAEIRNVVYEEVARATSVYVSATRKKQNYNKRPPPSLFLVSKRTRQEYLPLLLEFAPVAILVKDFDFRNLQRITSGLYSTELKALRNNVHLEILLQVDNKPSKDTIASLRRWLVSRAEGLDRLGWRYGIVWAKHSQIVPTSTQVHRSNIFGQRRELLRRNLEAMAQLHHNVAETLQFELGPIIGVFEDELEGVGVDPGILWRDESALMMFGVRYRNSSR